jgi:GntR family transcriptional repressor for pyruvate dehydrogenase complex
MAQPTNPRAWEAVLAHVEAKLVAGQLSPGDHLPPERLLAADLGVGRSSVREALRVLEVLGLVRTQTGSGPQSGAIIVARPTGGLSTLMRLQVAGGGFAVADIVGTRLVLEAAVVTALSEQHEPDLSAAIELLDAMDAVDPTAELDFLALDTAFHLALADAAGNAVITATMAGLRNAVEGYALAGAAFLPSWAATTVRLRAEHRAVVAAVVAGDGHRARASILAHISGYYDEINAAAPTQPAPTQPVT